MNCQMMVTGNFAKFNGSIGNCSPLWPGFLPAKLLVADTRGYMLTLPEEPQAQIARNPWLFLPSQLQPDRACEDAQRQPLDG